MSTPNDPQVTAFLRERYGLTGKHNPGKAGWLSGWKLPALIFFVVGGSWLVWSANHAANPEVRSTLISFKSESPTSISIRYSLQFKNPGKKHQCTLVARDKDKNTVGEIVDQIANQNPNLTKSQAGQTSITREILIPTRLQAVNAAILNCVSL